MDNKALRKFSAVKGLLYKDAYGILMSLKVFLVIVIFMALIPARFCNGIAVIYVALLPLTAKAFDEQAKWDKYAAVMPYAAKELVGSKYVLGLLGMGAVTCINLLAAVFFNLILEKNLEVLLDTVVSDIALLGIAMIFLSIMMPLVMYFGAEKGRLMIMLIALAIAFLGITALGVASEKNFDMAINMWVMFVIAIVLVLTLLFVSFILSVKFYEKKGVRG